MQTSRNSISGNDVGGDNTNIFNISTMDMSSLNTNFLSTSNYDILEQSTSTPAETTYRGDIQMSEPLHISGSIDCLKNIRISNANRLIIGQLNINSLRNKIEALKTIISGKIDILVITETKLDDTFPTNQFSIDGFSMPFRLDREGVGLLYTLEKTYHVENLNHIINQIILKELSLRLILGR